MRFGKPNPRNNGPSIRFGNPQPTSEPPEPERLPVMVQSYSAPMYTSTSEEHSLLSEAHADTEDAAPEAGDLVYADATPLWKRLAIGSTNFALRVVGGLPAWSAWAHNLLSADDHADTATGTVARGDVITGQGATPKWTRLAKGSSGHYLRSDGTDVAWGQVAFTEVSGTLTDLQHGALTTSSSHGMAGDVSGTTAATVVDKIKGKSVTTPTTPTDDSKYLKFNGSGLVWDTPSGTGLTVQEGDSTVASAVNTLDFAAADFNVTSSPAGEANVAWQGFTVEVSNAAVATDIKDIDFGSGFDVTASGGEAEISLDLSEVVTGDVTFSTNAATVTKIQGAAVSDPAGGDDGQFARYNSSGDTITWETPGLAAHALLSSSHSDAATDGVTRGSLIVGNSTPQWDELVIGSANLCLRSDGTDVAWSSGALDNNARVAVKKNGALVATRRGINFIEGSNVTLTVADDSGNEEVDVTIAQTSVSAATIIVQEGDVTVDGSVGTLDFLAADFNVTSSPAGEANIAWQGFTVEEANASVATNIKTLDFGGGFDVSASGGEADVTLDLSEVVTGDVSYTANAGTVVGLMGVAIGSAPHPMNVAHTLCNDATTFDLQWFSRDFCIAGWARQNIQNASSAASLPRVGGAGTNIPAPWVAHKYGHITGISVATEANVSGSGGSYTVALYKNGVSTGRSVTLTGAVKSGYWVQTSLAFTDFQAGDQLELRDSLSGSLANTGSQAQWFGVWSA